MSVHAADQFQVKAIVGAGSFALPWVLKNEGVAGGILTIVVAGLLSSYTMKHPPIQMRDSEAREMLDAFIAESAPKNHLAQQAI